MGTSSAYKWGFLVGAIVAVALAIVIKLVIFGKAKRKREYDERQQLALGRAYKLGYYTLMTYLGCVALFDLFTGIKWCGLYTSAFIGVLLSVGVFGVSSILHDAYLPLRTSPGRYIALFATLGGLNLLLGAEELRVYGTFIKDGMLDTSIVNPLIGVLLIILTVALAIKVRAEKRAGQAE